MIMKKNPMKTPDFLMRFSSSVEGFLERCRPLPDLRKIKIQMSVINKYKNKMLRSIMKNQNE